MKTCSGCGTPFTPDNPRQRYCNETCRNTYNMRLKRQRKQARKAEIETMAARETFGGKSHLSITEAARFLGVSRPTLYARINAGELTPLKVSSRTVRIPIEQLTADSQIQPQPIKGDWSILISKAEVLQKYNISESWLMRRMKEEGFREYLLNAKQLKHPDKQLAQNSAAGYWSTFRGFLKIAYQEKLLQENVNDYLESIDAVDGRREFLTLEEVRQLAATPCDTPDLKNASLFSRLTGLRISDILALNWSNIVKATNGGWCLRIKTEKTDTEATLPLSQEAYELCGKPGTGLVFKNLKRHYTQKPLQDWLKDASITKHFTFHCFRHTFATLQVNEGTDIYTVSHLLTHANIGTTQIYADIVDKSKRDAVERIKIKSDK